MGTAALAGGAVVLGGCGGGDKGGGDAKPAAPAMGANKLPLEEPKIVTCEPGVVGGRFIIATFAEAKTFNPITANEVSSNDVIDMLFHGLVWKSQARRS